MRNRGELSNRRGVSPVIATTLLIVITIIIAIIIFIWAKNFIGEAIEKNGQRVDSFCQDVRFEAVVFSDERVTVTNQGNVPLYGIELIKKGLGNVRRAGGFTYTIRVGEVATATLSSDSDSLTAGEEVIVTPVILGETKNMRKAYPCTEEYGKSVVVQESS